MLLPDRCLVPPAKVTINPPSPNKRTLLMNNQLLPTSYTATSNLDDLMRQLELERKNRLAVEVARGEDFLTIARLEDEIVQLRNELRARGGGGSSSSSSPACAVCIS